MYSCNSLVVEEFDLKDPSKGYQHSNLKEEVFAVFVRSDVVVYRGVVVKDCSGGTIDMGLVNARIFGKGSYSMIFSRFLTALNARFVAMR